MKHLAIQRVFERADSSKSDSDFAYFFSLLLAGESLAKIIAAGVIASLGDDKNRNRYRLEYSLVRKGGLGDWASVIEDAVIGTASDYLLEDARTERGELTKKCKKSEWQYDAVVALKTALEQLRIESDDVLVKTDMTRWFKLFTTLRNKTRGHGATQPGQIGEPARHLAKSLNLIADNFSLLRRPWAYLYRNLSGKYRVSDIAGDCEGFNYLKSHNNERLTNGIYILIGEAPRRVHLMESNPDLQDFYFPNGLKSKSYELLSYITDDKMDGDASCFRIPPGDLPTSETEGYGELQDRGKCFSNAPDKRPDYIDRKELETELTSLLLNDRHPIVTLLGSGGIGKTSLALKVIHNLFDESPYESIVWLSARDVDLLPEGPKPVRQAVLTVDDIAKFYAGLVLSEHKSTDKGFSPKKFFEEQLQSCEVGPCLFVFDNFETVQSPIDAYEWVDTHIRLPNKALITTRLREFKGDYPVEVRGMRESEAEQLINGTAKFLGVFDIITAPYKRDLIKESEGHPYVLKILLGEVAKEKKAAKSRRLIAGTENILTALFERTYAVLSPCAQRAFLTLSAWNSAVPRLALEAVLMHSMQERYEVEQGIESLLQFSLADIHEASSDGQTFISLPLVAREFGKKKLHISTQKSAINSDAEILQMLGPTTLGEPQLGLVKKLERMIVNISHKVESGSAYGHYEPILETVCQAYNPGRLLLAKWHMEQQTHEGYCLAKNELERFLENNPAHESAFEAWRMLANAYFHLGNSFKEVHAFIERAHVGSVPFHELSSTANKLNRVLKNQGRDIAREESRSMADRLATVLGNRKNEADAVDFSRMAWLELHRGQTSLAREYVESGLRIDPGEIHLRKLAETLG